MSVDSFLLFTLPWRIINVKILLFYIKTRTNSESRIKISVQGILSCYSSNFLQCLAAFEIL
jgi:hypothetical protein